MKFTLLLSMLLALASCVTTPPKDLPGTADATIEAIKPVELPPIEVTPPAPVPVEQPKDITLGGDTGEGSKPVGEAFPIPNTTKTFSANVVDTNYNAKQRAKKNLAVASIVKMMNDGTLKKRMNLHKYNSKVGFANTSDTPDALFEKLFKGAEALAPAIDYEMDLTVEMYRASNNVVGYTYPNKMKVYTNSKFADQYDECEVARNLFHEWSHKMGYGHDYDKTKRRPYSWPYAGGGMVEDECYAQKKR